MKGYKNFLAAFFSFVMFCFCFDSLQSGGSIGEELEAGSLRQDILTGSWFNADGIECSD